MTVLTDGDIARAWTMGQDRHALDRALLVLAIAQPGVTWDALVRLSVARRDGHLLDIYADTFGSTIETLASCPSCSATLEIPLSVAQLRIPDSQLEEATAEVDDWQLMLRRPHSVDVTYAGSQEATAAAEALLRRLVVSAREGGVERAPESVPRDILFRASTVLESLEAQADIQLGFPCSSCGQPIEVSFDIVSHLWAAIGRRTRSLQREVHVLASAYGWSEKEILDLHWRVRAAYVAQVRGV